jgi:hypothetical protein
MVSLGTMRDGESPTVRRCRVVRRVSSRGDVRTVIGRFERVAYS